VSTRFKVFHPGIGQHESLGAAIDQQHLKILFKTSKGAANGGSGNSEFFCGTTQSAGLRSSNEHHNVIGVVFEHQNATFTYHQKGKADLKEKSVLFCSCSARPHHRDLPYGFDFPWQADLC
jgi:hypothetical protein